MSKLLKNKTLLKVVSASVLCVIVLVMLGTFLSIAFDPSYGWFAENKEVIAEGMQVTVESTEYVYIKEVTVYKYNDDKTEVEVTNGSEADLTLSAYDSVITERNKLLGIVVQVDVLTSSEGIVEAVLSCSEEEIGTNISDIVYIQLMTLDISSSYYYTVIDSSEVVTVTTEEGTTYETTDGKEVFIANGTAAFKDKFGNTIANGSYVRRDSDSKKVYDMVEAAAFSKDGNDELIYPKYNFVTIGENDVRTKTQEIIASVDVTETNCYLFFYMNYDPTLLEDISIESVGTENTQAYDGDLSRLYFKMADE